MSYFTSSRACLLSCLVIFLALGTLAVDRSKFKKCDQSSFCKRNRAFNDLPTEHLPLYNVSSSIKRVGTSKISAEINSPFTSKPLQLELHALQQNTFRLRITENDPKRYQGPQDILLPLKDGSIDEIAQSDSKYTFYVDNKRIRGELTLSPFKIDFFVNDELVISGNQRQFFNFEHIRSKEEDTISSEIPDPNAQKPETWDDEADGVWEPPKIANPAAEGRWEETFGGTHRDSKPRGPTSVAMDFTFHDTNHVYGIPEHATDLALKPTRGAHNSDPYRLYNLDVFEYELNNEMALYGSIPFMLSHSAKRTLGLFWFNAGETWIDVSEGASSGFFAGSKSIDTHWISEGGVVDVFFMLGPNPYDVFGQYAALTGTAPVPPMFAIAYHQCKWNYKDQKEVAEVDFGFDSNNIPYDVIWLDIEHTDGKAYFTWDKNHFPTPKDMQDDVAVKGRKMVTIVDPHIKRESNYYIHKGAESAGDLYVKDRDGNDFEGHCWPGSSSWIDYTSPKARQWWADKFSYDVYQQSTPALFTWNDMNEPSVFSGPEVTMHKDAIHFGGVEHREVHNAYGMYMHMATAQGLTERNAGKNERPFVLSRAFFAGSQRYGAIWTGDNAGQWEHLAIAQPMLLSLGVAGLSFVGADVGGFFGNPEAELMTRWYQAGAFHPFFRAHAHLDSKRREPWLLGEPHMTHIREAVRHRYAFLPFWYTLYRNNSVSGIPVIRPIWVEYPKDAEFFAEQDQFLVGGDLLIKPVTSRGATYVDVKLPGTEPWYDFVANEKFDAPQSLRVPTPLDKIPVFQRGGSIIPKKERMRRSSLLMADDPYTLVVALDSKGSATGEIYVDDGTTFNYERSNQYVQRRFDFANGVLSSVNADPKGKFDIENTIERITVFGLKKPTRVVLKSAHGNRDLEFVEDGVKITVRKPGVRIVDDWTITFL
eukprot:TRINITY_DN1908_c0_g1_i2.p1 TRINITY_DN1908_c0_g1~~TRINITY_DN1908_c0_g1_i2.p1  ORF type:complete len:931 (+),score=264.69 TRINITY_DN1908_c0_g1_i2:127-2919(+)